MEQCIPVKDGIPYIPWIYHVFGDCTYGWLDATSVILGYLSILFWLNAQLPQVIENYKRGSSEGLSIKFLSIWLAGDSTNLIGCILTNQLPFQKYLGIYFVFIDICLLTQYIYYTKWRRQPKKKNRVIHYENESLPSNILSAFQHPSVQTPLLIPPNSILEDELGPYSTSSSPGKWYTFDDILKIPSNSSSNNSHLSSSVNSSKSKAFLAIMFFGFQLTRSTFVTNNYNPNNDNNNDMMMIHSMINEGNNDTFFQSLDTVAIGRIFAWVCTCLYLMSRIPQIRKNIKRRSVEGLSPSLFVFAALGNLTYTVSILLHPGHTRDSLMEAIPYLIGSAGTLTFDAAIFIQFLWYSKKKSLQPSQIV
ncbi:unnamed protein product [Cunninghamella blakesleeana]